MDVIRKDATITNTDEEFPDRSRWCYPRRLSTVTGTLSSG